jgi:glutaminyl-tRNA synthetase
MLTLPFHSSTDETIMSEKDHGEPRQLDFIRAKIEDDLRTDKFTGRIATRFPPEPNGYLHIGHAKAICLDFGVASEYGGKCNLRFDDTNPIKEEEEYQEAIKEDIRWLGFDWEDRLYHASDYFLQLYEFAEELICKGLAYIDSLGPEEIRQYRGTLTEPGQNSPDRNRPIAENLDLFRMMREGEFEEGKYVLRAKIDMASPNLNMRDPIIYRIRFASHHRTGKKWCIYPMYDFAHGLSDSLEKITHSLCTLEYEDHRPLYDWFLDKLDTPSRPEQTEFARLDLSYTIVSKRRLRRLVEEGHVSGWDDPRMPTIQGLRRRGYTREAIHDFCERIGVAKKDALIDVAQLEYCIRNDLNRRAPRRMAVLNPLKLVILNYEENTSEDLTAINNPEDPSSGTRQVPFSRVLYIEKEDFMEDPPKKFYRLSPGNEVRLRYGYFVKCVDLVKDSSGDLKEIHCIYDPATRGGSSPDGRKVRSTLHWVSAQHSVKGEVRLYDRLFTHEAPQRLDDFIEALNPDSLEIVETARLEPSLAASEAGTSYQFERRGYFTVDQDSKPGKIVFNRTITLRDTWARLQHKTRAG